MNAPLDPHGLLPAVQSGELKVMRQSTMGSFDICMRRAGYDIQPGRPRTSGEARCVGTSYHGGLEQYYTARRDGTITTPALVHEQAYACFQAEAGLFDEWDTSKGEAWGRVVEMLDRYFQNGWHWGVDHEVVGVEWEWYLPLSPGWAVKGSIDLLLMGPEGYVGVDHKTAGRMWPAGKELPRKQNQSPMYTWAIWQLLDELPYGFAFDVHTYAGKFDRRWTRPTPSHMQRVIEKAQAMALIFDTIPSDQLPPNPTSNLCSAKYCDHFSVCPMGQAGEAA